MHITDFRHYVRDVFVHVEMVKEQFPELPVYILGHSMVCFNLHMCLMSHKFLYHDADDDEDSKL